MDLYSFYKTVHILSSTVLFGTGLGTAFHMWRADRTGDVRVIANAARQTVLADWLFTAPAVIIQPLTGFLLIYEAGYALDEAWIMLSLGLYVLIGACWLPVVWIMLSLGLYVLIGACWLPVVWLQIRMRNLAAAALDDGAEPPPLYRRYMRLWFALGWPAFLSVIAIFALMVFRPES
jgi:uncharacterized membrane protein